MKNRFLFFCLSFLSTSAFSQNHEIPNFDFARKVLMENLSLRRTEPIDLENVTGSPYISAGYRPARIIMQNMKAIDSVPVRFNAYINKFNIIHKDEVYTIDSALEVSYYEVPDDTVSFMVFRSGYPYIAQQTPLTYYHLVAGGSKVHLLHLLQKNLYSYTVPGTSTSPMRKFHARDSWFIYSEKDGMREVKLTKKSIERALPSFAQSIDGLITEHGLNPRNEDDMIILLELLDGQ
jgi:hypothetical protein